MSKCLLFLNLLLILASNTLLVCSFDLISPPSPTSSLTVVNAINPHDLTYYKYCMSHSPSLFKIMINGQEVSSGEKLTLDNSCQALTIMYEYRWQAPLVSIAKKKDITYTINPGTDTIKLNFSSWNAKEPRIKASGCTFCSCREITSK